MHRAFQRAVSLLAITGLSGAAAAQAQQKPEPRHSSNPSNPLDITSVHAETCQVDGSTIPPSSA
jgi:hypothetical protein